MVGVCPPERDNASEVGFPDMENIVFQLPPFVAHDMRMNEVITLDPDFQTLFFKERIMNLLNWRRYASHTAKLGKFAP